MLSPFIFKHQRMSVDYYMYNIWCNVCMHFCHEDMVKNIFIMIVSLSLLSVVK